MDFLFSPLFSGSSGNATFVCAGKTRVLVDAGVSGSRIVAELGKIGVAPDSLDAILITHEHTDHIAGVGVLSRKFHLPVYATAGTWQAMGAKIGAVEETNIRFLRPDEDFYLGEMGVTPFAIPHDASEPVGYSFEAKGVKVSIATDLGYIRDSWVKAVSGSDMLLLESNYDPDMLKAGPYPYDLKTRILGRKGHLSNEDAGTAAVRLANTGVRNILLGHMSKENNFPELAWETTAGSLLHAGIRPNQDIGLALAYRDRMSGLYAIESGVLCARREET